MIWSLDDLTNDDDVASFFVVFLGFVYDATPWFMGAHTHKHLQALEYLCILTYLAPFYKLQPQTSWNAFFKANSWTQIWLKCVIVFQ